MRDVAFIALGSNVGDRDRHLAFAREAIADLAGVTVLAQTAVEETPPFGPAGQGPYLNQMLAVATDLEPHALLAALQDIERLAGRVRGERWGPRTLDLDIVKLAHQSVTDATLTVPHPGLTSREFWQRELAELEASVA